MIKLSNKSSKKESIKLIGLGDSSNDIIKRKEAAAKEVKVFKEKKIKNFSIDISDILQSSGIEAIGDIAEGAALALYEQISFKEGNDLRSYEDYEIELYGIDEKDLKVGEALLNEAMPIIEGIIFARDMVNLPGNKLRPFNFAKEIKDFLSDTSVEVRVIESDELHSLGLNSLTTVGDSSQYPPCMVVLRFEGNPESSEIIGLVGKGVTCDTGGYCLKASDSMAGIKGDMAGAAAVCGAINAIAKNNIKVNVSAVIPICENRISSGGMLPGDVITSYSGKTIEILNTDAEGRLILADGISFAIKEEKATKILDIATLTGAVGTMLGPTIAGVICDDNLLYQKFERAALKAGERYMRLPFYEEHEKMIESKIADVRNMGEKYCGTITAGLFLRTFAEGVPWIHLDIAGTASIDPPFFEYQSTGATGIGVSSIYRLCCELK